MQNMNMPMLPGVATYQPPLTPFLPGATADPEALPIAQPRSVVELNDGDTLNLEARIVRKTINGNTFVMYGFNGQHLGPLILGVDVRNVDGLIALSDTDTGFWMFKMAGFQGWKGEDWAMPNISSVQNWDNGPVLRTAAIP